MIFLLLTKIITEFDHVVKSHRINLEQIDNDIKDSIIEIEVENNKIKESLRLKTKIITTKLGIAIGINTPIGLILGTKMLICIILASGIF